MQNAMDNRHPGDAEAAAAIAGMADTYGYRPTPGDVVIGEPPFAVATARAAKSFSPSDTALRIATRSAPIPLG